MGPMDNRSRLVTVVLEVADLERSVRLYRDGFGLALELSDHQGAEHGQDDRWISGAHGATSGRNFNTITPPSTRIVAPAGRLPTASCVGWYG